MSYKNINKELISWAKEYKGEKFHAVLCDPPYDIGFMSKDWDTNACFKEWGEAIKSVLLPGAIVMAFGGTRKWHRLACGFEDAGLEMWDTCMWLYGQGFPKAQDISKLIDKKRIAVGTIGEWGLSKTPHGLPIMAPASDQSAPWSGHKTTALKPAWEPILCFKVPSDKGYAELALEYGIGCLNIDECRIPLNGDYKSKANGRPSLTGLGDNYDPAKANQSDVIGRYPANLIIDEEVGVLLDEQSGRLKSGVGAIKKQTAAGYQGNAYGKESRLEGTLMSCYGDTGGASRFFYCPKASTKERNLGLEDAELEMTVRKNIHPTVKPIDLCRYFANLLLPPDSVKPRRILVPFSGSGSEMIGCHLAGWDEIVGVEKESKYCEIAEARLKHWTSEVLPLLENE